MLTNTLCQRSSRHSAPHILTIYIWRKRLTIHKYFRTDLLAVPPQVVILTFLCQGELQKLYFSFLHFLPFPFFSGWELSTKSGANKLQSPSLFLWISDPRILFQNWFLLHLTMDNPPSDSTNEFMITKLSKIHSEGHDHIFVCTDEMWFETNESSIPIISLCQVHANPQMKNTTNMLILNLAVADLLFILICVPFTASDYVLMYWPFGLFWYLTILIFTLM